MTNAIIGSSKRNSARGAAAARERFTNFLRGALLAVFLLAGAGPAIAIEVGEAAPDFTMPSTMGGNVSLSDYRGKKWVLLEFYGADFAPT